jgi:hypothetical protein
MTDRVFLTEKRRDVLNGEYEGSPDALRNQKSRLRKSARTALEELIAVANSEEIENGEVFHPNDLARLVHALMTPADGLTPLKNFDGTEVEYRQQYAYQFAVHGRLSHTLDGYDQLLHELPDEPDFLEGWDADDF